MLGVFLDSNPDSFDKNIRLTQVLAKESLKFFPNDEDVSFILHLPLMLLPVKQDGIFEENSGKWYPILTFSPSGGKMFLTLLEKVIALQVSFIPIYVWESGF